MPRTGFDNPHASLIKIRHAQAEVRERTCRNLLPLLRTNTLHRDLGPQVEQFDPAFPVGCLHHYRAIDAIARQSPVVHLVETDFLIKGNGTLKVRGADRRVMKSGENLY